MESVNPYKQQELDQLTYQQGYVRRKELDDLREYYKEIVKELTIELEETNAKLGLYRNILLKIKKQHESNSKMFDLFVN